MLRHPGHVDRRAGAGRRRDIDELQLVGSVAGGINVRTTGAHALINNDGSLLIGRDTRRIQNQGTRIRTPASGDQQLVRARFAVIGNQHELAVCMCDLAGQGVFHDLDAFRAEHLREGCANGRIFAEEE